MTITGPILVGDFNTFASAVKKNGAPRLVRLESDGGEFGEALGIGIMIHKLKINTETIGPCFSSCAYIWLAGHEFKIGNGSIIGIHAPANVYLPDTFKTESNNYIDAGWYLGMVGAPLAAAKNFLAVADLVAFVNLTETNLDVLGYEKIDAQTFKAP